MNLVYGKLFMFTFHPCRILKITINQVYMPGIDMVQLIFKCD